MNPQQQQPKRKTAFNEEYDVMQAIQEDRMAYHASIACHERCVHNYYFNNFYWREKTCMENCLAKINQATVITNINYGKFEAAESKKRS